MLYIIYLLYYLATLYTPLYLYYIQTTLSILNHKIIIWPEYYSGMHCLHIVYIADFDVMNTHHHVTLVLYFVVKLL